MAEEAAGPTLRTDSNRMQSELRILLRKHLGFPRHEGCRLEQIGLRDFRDILSISLWKIPSLWNRLKTKRGKQVGNFMAFCYWYRCFHRQFDPDECLAIYAEGNTRDRAKAKKAIVEWFKEGPPKLHKRHFWAHVRPKGKRVNYSDPADDESNCIAHSDLEDGAEEWDPSYEDPVGISVEPNEEDGFMTDMEDHGPDWDEDTVHIEVEDELRRRRTDAQVRVGSTQSRRRPPRPIPTVLRFTRADVAAGMMQGRGLR